MTIKVRIPKLRGITTLWLRSQPELSAVVGNRIYPSLPSNKTFPLMRVTSIYNGAEPDTLSWSHKALMQIDVWAKTANGKSGEDLAFEIARDAAALFAEQFIGEIIFNGEGVAPQHVQVGGLREGYDPTDETLPLVSFDVSVKYRPVRIAGS